MQLIGSAMKHEKPWGHEEWLHVNERYVVKRLFMKKGERCSLQFHRQKHESIYVLSGKLLITIGEDSIVATGGDFFVITPNTIHRMEGLEDSFYLEASTPELDDVVRVSDDYGRNV